MSACFAILSALYKASAPSAVISCVPLFSARPCFRDKVYSEFHTVHKQSNLLSFQGDWLQAMSLQNLSQIKKVIMDAQVTIYYI